MSTYLLIAGCPLISLNIHTTTHNNLQTTQKPLLNPLKGFVIASKSFDHSFYLTKDMVLSIYGGALSLHGSAKTRLLQTRSILKGRESKAFASLSIATESVKGFKWLSDPVFSMGGI